MNKRTTFLIAALVAVVCCISAASPGNVRPVFVEESEGEILYEVFGDLDNDSIPERVVAFRNSAPIDEEGICEIRIYRKKNNDWQLWYKAIGPIWMNSADHPSFKELKIERRAIVVAHAAAHDFYTHRYRCNNGRWELIGSTIYHEGRCGIYSNVDYNLSTGTIAYASGIVECEENEGSDEYHEATYRHKLDKLPEMNGFHPGENEVKIAGCKDNLRY